MNELQIGDIVQIYPSMDGFGGCLAVVSLVTITAVISAVRMSP